MPLVSCPKCSTALRVPDGPAAAVRCPACQTVFTPGAPPPKPAFEVVEEAPPPPPPPPKPKPKPAPPPPAAARPAPPKPPPPKPQVAKPAPPPPRPAKREALDLDDDPPPRRRRDEDEDDDRPRSRYRSRDDEDEDDDRPRRRSRRDDYDDEYDDYAPRRPDKGAPYRRGAVGALLLAITFWLYLATFGFLVLFAVIAWAGGKLPDSLVALPGLTGAANWLVAAVAVGFCVAGPAKARGMSIAATVVLVLHLVFLLVCLGKMREMTGVLDLISDEPRPAARGGMAEPRSSVSTTATFVALTGEMWAVDATIPLLIYASKGFGDFVFYALAGALEVARLILLVLTVRGMAAATKGGGEAAAKGGFGLLIVSVTTGAAVVLALLVAVILGEGKPSFSTAKTLLGITVLLVYLGYTLMLIVPAMAAHQTRAAMARRGR